MNLQIIPKQNMIPDFDSKAIKIQYIEYTEYHPSGNIIEGDKITEEVISELLKQILSGTSVYLSLVPYCEDNWFEVVSDGTWLALGYSSNDGQDNYYSYNLDFEGIEEMSPLLSEGQSPIEKYLALTDKQAGLKAVEYFFGQENLVPTLTEQNKSKLSKRFEIYGMVITKGGI